MRSVSSIISRLTVADDPLPEDVVAAAEAMQGLNHWGGVRGACFLCRLAEAGEVKISRSLAGR